MGRFPDLTLSGLSRLINLKPTTMPASLPNRFRSLSGELKALALGHWQLLRQEMSGKINLTRREIVLMVAGALTALTAILLVLAALTLLLSQLFVSQAGWEPLIAGGVSALIIAGIFALTGWLVIRGSGARLKSVGFTPVETMTALKSAANALTNQPLIPTPPTTPMNTRQQFKDALHQTADTVEHQARRAGRAVQDTAHSLGDKFDPGAFFASALSWVDAVMTPQNRALARRAAVTAATLPRRHPAIAALLGLGAGYAIWKKSQGTAARDQVEQYAAEKAEACRDFANDARKTATHGYKAAVNAGKDLRESLFDTAHRVAENGRAAASQFTGAAATTVEAVRDSYGRTRETLEDSVDTLSDAARQLRDDAEAGYKKAREFVKDEPALAIAGGVALALGALLLIKSSRR